MNVDWGFAGAVVIVGLVVVFAVLLILVVFCALMGTAFKSMGSKGNGKKEEKPAAQAPKAAAPVEKAAPVVESGIGDDVIAAISAAIACMMGGEQKFALRSIKRAKGSRPVWNAAGIAESTRPF
jgi:sodium pump decarboxylase gamma subunit